ncbi:MAG TPA: hypothetical protein VL133_16390 [Devosia sp.]|nr:hypothetical protein [Devosia sp.]
MALLGKAVMMNWSNVAPIHRPDYYSWHNREHIAGRLAIPGFRRGRRMRAIDADRDFFNLYEVDSLAVLTGPDYSAKAGNPSPETKRTGTMIKDAIRALAHVRYSDGMGQGGVMLTARFALDDDAAAAPMIAELMPLFAGLPDIVGAHLCVADTAASTVITADRRGRPTTVPHWAIIIEATTREGLERARSDYLHPAATARFGFAAPPVFGFYGLQLLMSKADLDAPR